MGDVRHCRVIIDFAQTRAGGNIKLWMSATQCSPARISE